MRSIDRPQRNRMRRFAIFHTFMGELCEETRLSAKDVAAKIIDRDGARQRFLEWAPRARLGTWMRPSPKVAIVYQGSRR